MIETALTFENPEDDSALQIELDTNGYSITVFDPDGSLASMVLDEASMGRFVRFINLLNKETNQ